MASLTVGYIPPASSLLLQSGLPQARPQLGPGLPVFWSFSNPQRRAARKARGVRWGSAARLGDGMVCLFLAGSCWDLRVLSHTDAAWLKGASCSMGAGGQWRVAGGHTGDYGPQGLCAGVLETESDGMVEQEKQQQQREEKEDGQRDEAEAGVVIPCNAELAKSGAIVQGSLAVDWGSRRVGLAVSRGGYAPFPLKVLHLSSSSKAQVMYAVQHILSEAHQQGADEVIVGLPCSVDSSEGIQAKRSRRIALQISNYAALHSEQRLRVYLQDEYNSTKEAMDLMLQRGVGKKARQEQADSYAASVILMKYFDENGRNAEFVHPSTTKAKMRFQLSSKALAQNNPAAARGEKIPLQWQPDALTSAQQVKSMKKSDIIDMKSFLAMLSEEDGMD